MSAVAKIMAKVTVDENGCWLVPAWSATGYSYVKSDGVRMLSHRVMYEDSKGAIPQGFQIDHLCSVRNCVNPEHLEAVTQQENIRRAAARRTTCRYGHTLDGKRISNGKTIRRCLTCHRERERNARIAIRFAESEGPHVRIGE